MRVATLVASALCASAASQLLWQQHENVAVYTSASLSRHVGTTPTFATATWLNPPEMIETFNVTDNGSYIWQYILGSVPQGQIPTFLVDMARHAVSFPASASVVDTVGALANFVPPSSCTVLGFDSTGTSTPIWTWNLSNCDSSLLYDDERYVDVSDDGSTAAFSGFIPSGTSSSPLLVVFDAQTGAVRYQKTFGEGSWAGPVGVSAHGSYVGWVTGAGLTIYDGTTGAVRGTIPGVGHTAKVSDDGSFVIDCEANGATVYAWSGSAYAANETFTPSGGGTWYCEDSALSSDSTLGNLAVFGWIGAGSLTARVTVYAIASGTLLTDWTSSTNAQLQTNPTVRLDGIYAGVALWGDADDVPTAVVLAAGSSTPVFTYTTPGSMFGVDIVVDAGSSTPTSDAVYFAVAGKAVPANEVGNGGDAFAWRIDVPK